jgi:hypothetical protein
MSVESRPNKLVKGLVLDTFHTDVDNTVATYALNAQLEDQEGNHFHYGSEVGTTYIKEIPEGHVVIGHINMERNETVLFTTDGTNSTIGILSRNDNMAYNYEIKVDDTKQEKKLNFKKQGYVRGVYRLLNGCDKVIYFVDGINKDRRLNINQLDSYKITDPQSVASGIIFDDSLRVTIFALASATGNIQLIRLMSANVEANASVLATLISGESLTKLLDVSVDAFATALATLTRTANLISSEEAKGTTTVNVDIIRLLQTNVSALASVNATLESSQQGVVEINATVSGEALATVTLLRSVLLEVTLTTEATTVAEAILTKVINAQVEALADTSSSAQISIPITVTADATSTTDADVILSSAINVSADATAETTAIVQLSKVISASVDALADSSSEALIGLILVSTSTASASVSTVNLVIGNSLVASVTAEGTTTAELIIAELLESSVNAQADTTTANSLVSKLLESTVSGLATPTNTLTVADVLTASVTGAATVTSATLDVVAPLLLDLYPNAAAAYSLRKLRTAYTGNAIRVRRSSDNTEQNIGFTALNVLDEAALTTFCGSGNGFVTIWYDQSGNAKNAEQSTASNQPQIVSSGSVIKVNNTTSIEFPGTHKLIISNSTSTFNFLHNGTESTVILLAKRNNDNDLKWFLGNTAGSELNIGTTIVSRSNNRFQNFVNNGNLGQYPILNITSNNVVNTSNTYIYFNHFDSDNVTAVNRSEIYINNGSAIKNNTYTLSVSSSNASFNMNIGGNNNLIECINGSIKEIIFYDNNKLNDRTNIITNINTHYGIY